MRPIRGHARVVSFSFREANSLISLAPPEHGGRLRLAAERFGIPLTDWLDLSTGINPRPWPVPDIPSSAWSRLPETADGLEQAAAHYYGAEEPLPLAGSQAAIQALPRLRAPCRVGVPEVGYAEHAYAWRCAGHEVVTLPEGDATPWLGDGKDGLDCLVVVNPNNPTGRRWPPERLLDWHVRLAARGGWLVVDEAFMDATPEASLMPYAGRPGLILLRSFGKFFGLAGARVGFLIAESALRQQVERALGPWALTGPSRWVAARALEDSSWQATTAARLRSDSVRLGALLHGNGLTPSGGTALFQWAQTADAERVHSALAKQGILTRHFSCPSSLRLGLPGNESGWRRLSQALEGLSRSAPARPAWMSGELGVRCRLGSPR